MPQKNIITYVANAGVLLYLKDKKILIDGLSESGISIYKETPAEISEKIIKGIPPFDNIDIMLITHQHEDHFSLKRTVEFIKHNPNTIVISNDWVISEITRDIAYPVISNLIVLKPELYSREKITVDEISIQVISMLHDGKGYEQIQNLAYLIDNGVKKILHIGDASPIRENYNTQNLKQEKVDLLIAPFPYIALPKARKIIEEHINPLKIAIVHFPHEEFDKYGWIKATKKCFERVKDNFVKTELLERIGCSISI